MTRLITAEDDGWPALYRHVLQRDGRCVFAYMPAAFSFGAWPLTGDRDHWCRDKFREPIDWSRAYVLSVAGRGGVELDHVKMDVQAARKAPDDEAHLVVACVAAHHGGLATSEAGRVFERFGLAILYPEVWAPWIERVLAVRESQADLMRELGISGAIGDLGFAIEEAEKALRKARDGAVVDVS